MKRIKIEVTCLFLLFAVLFLSGEISNDSFRRSVMCLSALGIAALVYQITNEVLMWLKEALVKNDSELKQLSADLSVSIEKYGSEQNKCTGNLISVIESLTKATEQYIKRVDALAEIQEDIVEEESNLCNEIGKMRSGIATNLAELSAKVQKCLSENEESMEGILNNFCAEFKEAQKSANEAIDEAKNSINVLKMQVKVSLDTFKKDMCEQTEAITAGLDDCSGAIEDGLNKYRKEQEKRDTAQNKTMNVAIESIRQTVAEEVSRSLKANEDLLKYLQQVQEDWTTLSKDEIAFLNKLWAE